MKIIPVQVFGEIDEMAYFYAGESKKSVLIDPGAETEKLKKIVKDNALKLVAILLTHGHFDHIGAAEELAVFYDIPIYTGIGGRSYTSDASKNLSMFTSSKIEFDNVTEKNEGDTIEIDDNIKLKIIATPGHTEDGATYYDEKNHVAFVGDTIFEGSYGRTDFPGGSEKILFKSIKEKIFNLPEDTKLFSGHSDVTTVKIEKTRAFYFFNKP